MVHLTRYGFLDCGDFSEGLASARSITKEESIDDDRQYGLATDFLRRDLLRRLGSSGDRRLAGDLSTTNGRLVIAAVYHDTRDDFHDGSSPVDRRTVTTGSLTLQRNAPMTRSNHEQRSVFQRAGPCEFEPTLGLFGQPCLYRPQFPSWWIPRSCRKTKAWGYINNRRTICRRRSHSLGRVSPDGPKWVLATDRASTSQMQHSFCALACEGRSAMARCDALRNDQSRIHGKPRPFTYKSNTSPAPSQTSPAHPASPAQSAADPAPPPARRTRSDSPATPSCARS